MPEKSAFMLRFICVGRITVDGMNASGMLLGDSVRLLSPLHDAPAEGRARGTHERYSPLNKKQKLKEWRKTLCKSKRNG